MKLFLTHLYLITALALPALLTSACASNDRDTPAYVDDQTLAAKVKSDLLRDPVVNGATIEVSTFRREVRLSGYVDTEQEKERARQIAASVPGISGVQNDIVVQTGR